MLLLTRIYNNLPTNRKTAEVGMKIHKFDHAVMSESEFDNFKQWVTQTVEVANEMYPRTKKLHVTGMWRSSIVIRLDGSEQCLSMTFDTLGRAYSEIIGEVLGDEKLPVWECE